MIKKRYSVFGQAIIRIGWTKDPIMKYSTITLDILNSTAIITLNRPNILNAYTVQMGNDLVQAFQRVKTNDTVRSVILTGAGRAFCAGVDLNQLKQGGDTTDKNMLAFSEERFLEVFCEQLFHLQKPIIAAINGPAIGIGVTMTLPCDIRLASEGAKFGMPFSQLGIVQGLGSTFLPPKLLNLSRSKLLVLTGQPILAREAKSYGLVDKVVPRSELMGEAISIAEFINDNPPCTVELIKKALNLGVSADSTP
jgi:enoyl-CoA hydratase/carnithine racemase